MTTPLLQLCNLVKSYGRRRVVDDVSLNVCGGEIVGLLGPNGAGKTTSFKMAVGMVRPERGQVILQGTSVTHKPMYQRARLGLGYLSQEPSIFRGLTVQQNIEAILELTFRGSRRERQQRLSELLGELDLTRLARSEACRLSGGEKRRLEITRALAVRPRVLLLDEPFSGIDPIAVSEIQDIVVKLRNEHGLGILLTDHNVSGTLSISDRAYVIHEGRVFREGDAATLVNDPEVRKHYLGDRFEMTGLTARQESA
jgi:lipopolysaccharide export system ATP-binding protein